MLNKNEQEILKSTAKKIDPSAKDVVSNLMISLQNQELIAGCVEKLQKAIKEYPNDAAEMTLDEFLKAHPEMLDAEEAKIMSSFTLPATALTNLLKQFLNNPNRIESPRRNRIVVEEHYLTKNAVITYKSEDATYTLTVERIKELFVKRVQNGAKIFNFLLEKLNEQNYVERTEFLLSELIEAGIYANPDSAYRGLKTVLEKLMSIHVEASMKVYEGRKRKEVGYVKAAIVGQYKVTYNKCIAVLPPAIREHTPYITILPRWGYALQSENAYMLLDYIYYLARQNTNKIRERGYFTINLDTVRQHLGIPSPEEIKDEYNGRYNQLIIKPIEDAIAAIEEKKEDNDLKITQVYDSNYKNIHEYLDGYLEIRMSGASLEYMLERAVQEEKRIAEAQRKALPPSKKTDKKEE